MNRNQLQWFCSAYEMQSFAKAAKASFVSRQAFGKAIKSMESELECPLFQRTEQGVTPTEAALRIYPIAQRCVEDLRSMKKICDEYSPNSQRVVRMAIADGIVESMDESFFDELEHMNPSCEIIIEKHFYTRCLEYLREGRVDFAIAPGPVSEEALNSIPLVQEQVFVAAAPEIINFPVEDATLENLATMPFFQVGEGEQAMLGFDILCRKHGLELRKVDKYTEFGIVIRKAHSGVAAVLVSRQLLSYISPDMVLIPLPLDMISWSPHCFWLPRPLSNVEASIVDFMRKHTTTAAA